MNVNRVFLAGNLTRDPAVRFLAGDKSVAEFGLAVNRKWKDASGQSKEEVTFVDCEAWGKTAELVGQYLKKGSGAFIEGRLKLDSWDDKETGQKRSKLKVSVDNVQFVGGKADDRQQANPAPARPSAPAPSGGGSADEPPFMRRGEWE